ncbi:NADH-quinone oxidoreductase subunit NuoK [Fundidesulfovibrio soli]|uniref:NADH-quinone oxidoreductase subunit NuoK n=1 Tax=Fundidesulfovibrio soli TaxID=2922716 RepID=UPI001FAF0EB0|nr:NADH-quinone oxidoreductase subunit NuoK [Fundidesulfovibrio soli]
MIVPFEHILILATALFVLGAACAAMRRSVIMILVGVEIMITGAAVAFVGASLRWQTLDGQAAVILVMGLAAAEVAFGLALLVHARRRGGSLEADGYTGLKG